MMTHGPGESRRGTSLLETLMYVVCLAIVINVSAQVVLTCTRLSAFGTAVADRYTATHDVESMFAGAVREATAVASGVGEYRTGPETLVLQTFPADETSGRRYIVLGCFKPERLSRLVLLDQDGALSAETMDTLPIDLAEVGFSFGADDPAAARSITMTYRLKTPSGREAQSTPRHLEAALRSFGSEAS